MVDEVVEERDTPRAIRMRGVKLLALGLVLLAVARLYVFAQVSLFPGTMRLPGVFLVLPPVIAAVGLTQLITGNDKSLLRLPLVVLLAIALIALTFWLLVPRGYF